MFFYQNRFDAFAHVPLNPCQAAAGCCFVNSQHGPRFPQTQAVEVIQFDEQTILSLHFLDARASVPGGVPTVAA